jgi:Pretoxin HINT domain/Domain of unknown function (DUF4280)
MADELEYIVNTALTHCDKGMAMLPFTSTINTTVHIQKQLVATEMDKEPLVNIPSYGMCSVTKSPCNPLPTVWDNTYEFVKVKTFKPLLFKSCMQCGSGGKIEFLTSGQLPLADSVDAESLENIEEANKQSKEAVEEFEAQKDAVGESGFWEGFIPVWGSGRDAINSFQTGHWGWGLFHVGMVAVDVFTLGIGSLVKGAVKGVVKAGVKATLKQAGKAALEGLSKKAIAAIAAKEAAVAMVKNAGKGVAEFSVKRLGICIARACFVAGTPVATKDGLKNIEEIKVGDKVWSYDEKTGEIGLREVLNTIERKINTLVELTIDGEKILTTPEHPFYSSGEWKEAGLLETGDNIMLFSGRLTKVQSISYQLDAIKTNTVVSIQSDTGLQHNIEVTEKGIKVFNFEVEGWHTYFVGFWKFLVHNAQVCFSTMILESQKWFQNIMRGNSFNMVMNNALRYLYTEKGLKYLDEVYVALKNGKNGRIDGFIKGKAIIERKATDLAKVTEKTAKSYIDNAAMYKDAKLGGKTLKEQIFLQVENMQGVSKEVLDYAAKKGVTIIDDITKLPGL